MKLIAILEKVFFAILAILDIVHSFRNYFSRCDVLQNPVSFVSDYLFQANLVVIEFIISTRNEVNMMINRVAVKVYRGQHI